MARGKAGMVRPVLKLAAAAALGYASAQPSVAKADAIAFKQMRKRRTPGMDRVLPVATDLGSMYAAAGIAAALAALGKRRLAVQTLGAAATAWGLAQASKRVFNRPRPYHGEEPVEVLVREPAGTSYPSGHPAVAAALSSVLAPQVNVVGPVIERMPKLVAASRIYVGVHYPSDVIGGVLVGDAVGELWRRFTRSR